MSEIAAVTNQLKTNNAAAEARDAKKSQQDQSNADAQRGFFANLAESLKAGRENVENGLKNVVTVTKKGILSPTDQKEKDNQQKGLFGKLGDKFTDLSKSLKGFFAGIAKGAKDKGLDILKNLALGLFFIGFLKFLQSPMFDTFLDQIGKIFHYFDRFGEKLSAFFANPSFSTLTDLFGESGPILLALGAVIALFAPLKTLKFLTATVTTLVGLFTKDGLVTKAFRSVSNKFSAKGAFDALKNGATSLMDGVKNIGGKIAEQGKRFGTKALNVAGSGFNMLKSGVATMYDGLNNLGSKIGNVLKQGGGAMDRGMTKAMGGVGRGVSAFGKTALGALKFAGPAGLIATAALTVGSGVMAGIKAYKETGDVGTAVKEGFSGALSSLTFGFVKQEDISAGLTTIGDNVTKGFNAVKNFYVDGYTKIGDGISKVVNDPKGAFNAVSDKIGGLIGVDLPNFDESKQAIVDLGSRLKTGFEDFTGIQLPTSLDEAKETLTSSLSSLGDTLSEKFAGLKEGVGGFFSSIFGGDDKNAKASIESDVIKLKEKEIDTLSEKIVDAEARFEKIKKILEGGVTARERRDLRRLGIEAPSGLKAKENANEEIALLREQIANMNKQLEQAQSSGTTTNINAPQTITGGSMSETKMVITSPVNNPSAPAGVAATT
tara:strand:- start:979 stop:2961 length:1983 start_codon:yes stop_codon:yes gene_type:complete